MATLAVKGLVKKFGNTFAVDDVSLEFPDHKLTVLVGPSGCGKTTLLRIVAGLEEPTGGQVTVANRDVTLVPAWDRNFAMVFQSYALYPHMNVFKNIAFPLEARHTPKQEIKMRVEQTASILEIEQLLHRYPRQLSGGQMQRVAIGRAIVRKPEVFLMDEPLSNLDAQLRVNMRAQLKRLQMDLGVTTIYVTHDQAEAMTLADQLVVMNHGHVLQVGSPEDVYRFPDTNFVARFIGSPEMNMIKCHLDAARTQLSGTQFLYRLPPALQKQCGALPVDRELALGVRPEDIKVEKQDVLNAVPATVYLAEALGKETLLTLKCGDTLLKATIPASWRPPIGTPVWMSFEPEALRVFDAEKGARLVPCAPNGK